MDLSIHMGDNEILLQSRYSRETKNRRDQRASSLSIDPLIKFCLAFNEIASDRKQAKNEKELIGNKPSLGTNHKAAYFSCNIT